MPRILENEWWLEVKHTNMLERVGRSFGNSRLRVGSYTFKAIPIMFVLNNIHQTLPFPNPKAAKNKVFKTLVDFATSGPEKIEIARNPIVDSKDFF